MGYNYSITGNDQLEISGFNCEDDLHATIDFKSLIRRFNQLKRMDDDPDYTLTEDEDTELNILEEYVTPIKDDDEDEDDDE